MKPVQNEHQSRCAGLQATTVHGRVLTRSHSLSTLHTRNKQSCILSKWVATPAACFSVALRPQRRVGLLGTGTEWEGDERVKGSTAETARKRPERPWTAARTMEVLRRCPLAIAQRLGHCAIAVSTAVLDRVTLQRQKRLRIYSHPRRTLGKVNTRSYQTQGLRRYQASCLCFSIT